MFHWQILAGLIGGLGLSLRQAATPEEGLIVSAGFLACVIGTCAAFYVLFLCRMLGAGDIKLMAVCSGILGPWDGCLVIFLGLFLAAVRGAWILMADGVLWGRLERLSGFVIRCGRSGRLEEYPGRNEQASGMQPGTRNGVSRSEFGKNGEVSGKQPGTENGVPGSNLGKGETERLLHLGPYLFMGYCIWLILQR